VIYKVDRRALLVKISTLRIRTNQPVKVPGERRRSDVSYLPFQGAPHNDAPAAFGGTHLDPIYILSIESNLFKSDRP
jgi:hypothetical protein